MKYFKMKEFVRSNTADHYNIDNTPTVEASRNIETLVKEVLDPLRAKLGEPIRVTSGYRNPILNQMVGGVENSQHLKGEAADVTCSNILQMFNVLVNELCFDQCRLYLTRNYIHISYSAAGNNRHQINIVR